MGEGNSERIDLERIDLERIDLERIDLERMQLAIQQRISGEMMGATIGFDRVAELCSNTIIAEMRMKLAAMPLVTETVSMTFESPDTWWQMFRRDVLRRPCRMRTDTQRKEVRLMAGVPEALLRITHGAGPIHYWTIQGDACDGRGK